MKSQSAPTLAAVNQPRLVLCRVFDKRDRLVKRWLKPSTPALIPCTECGFQDTNYAKHAATHVCLDCYSCKENAAMAPKSPPQHGHLNEKY